MVDPISVATVAGPVTIGTKTLMIEKLSTEKEIGLESRLSKMTRDEMGPGGFFSRMKASLDWMKAEKMFQEWEVAVRELTRLQGTGAPPSAAAIDSFRQTAAGVAEELYWRTRGTHPEVVIEEIKAVVTDVNAIDVHMQILRVVTDSGKA